VEFDDFDEDDEFYSPPPHPDDRLWRHPAEVAAEARNAAPFAGHEEPPLLARVASRWPLALAAVGAGVVVTMLGVSQLFAPGAGVASPDAAGTSAVLGTAAAVDVAAAPSQDESHWARNVRSLVEPSVPTVEVVRGADKIAGRGIFIAEAGYIMTSAQLVDGADMLLVDTNSDHRYIAEFVGADPLTDVAVIRITNGAADNSTHPVAALAASGLIQVGQPLLAMANNDPRSVSVGQVTETRSSVTLQSGDLSYGFVEVDLAPQEVDPGTAVFDALGSAVGMVPSVADANARVSMIPIDVAYSVATSLISGTFERPWLGVGVGEAAEPGRIRNSVVEVTELYDGGPALALGIELGDRFVSVGGRPITTISDLLHAVWAFEPGDSVDLGILRGREHRLLRITLGLRPGSIPATDQ